VVVLDDEDRENEGDLIINADKITTEAMAFMVEHTSGVVSSSSSSACGSSSTSCCMQVILHAVGALQNQSTSGRML
jgi:3,4-dihydroxy-2-butanone 4-phosphate synthase